jgi:SpoVK/Ycf46/Vps4 family AAA+-type ATPase
LTRDQLILCNSHVRGYSLKIKEWVEFSIDSIKPISWNDNAFPNLVLQTGWKDLILSFIESHIESKSTFDDFIEGKGQGVIMLLVGSPGIGKTLTAEAMADYVRKPLYILSAGELGSDSHAVESKLESVLEITERWDGVLLFDECDVFLQKRSLDSLEHNEIVSVFLR